MSRRRNPGERPESFNLRWHSVANPATPSVDIMSSPDPLNDPATPDPITSSSTRRITRSQRAQKFLSLGVSPRKQAYELDVGDSSRSSRGLVVSVETDDDQSQDGDTRRRLFPTPSPGPPSRRREKITTTTVPLKESIEDESSDVLGPSTSTPPPRRGRIRTSNGTPIPKSGIKRRAPTPIKKTPRRPETVPDSMSSDNASDAGGQGSPTPKRRARTPRKRAVEPSSELGAGPASAMTSVRRSGRRRRQALAPDELVGFAGTAQSAPVEQEPQEGQDDVALISDPVDAAASGQQSIPTPGSEADAESDIWMTTLSQDATPRASIQNARPPPSPSPAREIRESSEQMSDDGGYGFLAPAASDSSADEPPAAPTIRNEPTTRNDTIAQGEDFSMIFADSIPSLQADMSRTGQANIESELGDDTNMVINNTLESLRQGADADREDEGDDEEIEPSEEEPPAPEDEPEAPEPEFEAEEEEEEEEIEASEEEPAVESAKEQPVLEDEPGLFVSQNDDFDDGEEHFPVEAEAEEEPAPEPTPIRPSMRSSPKTTSPRLAESARRPKNSPLRHRVLRQAVAANESSPRQSLGGNSPDRTPRASERNVNIQEPADDSDLYDDSFSEIPDAVLEAATPKRPGMSATYNDEMDDEVDEVAMEAAFDNAELNQQTDFAEQEQQDYYEDEEEAVDNLEDQGDQNAPQIGEDDLEDVGREYPDEDEDLADEDVEELIEEAMDQDIAEDDPEDLAQEYADEGEDLPHERVEEVVEESVDQDAGEDADEMEQDAMEEGYQQVPYANAPAQLEPTPPIPNEAPNFEEERDEVAPIFASRRSRSHSLLSSPARRPSTVQPSPNQRLQQSTAQQAEAESQRSGSSKDATPRNQISSPLQEPQSLIQETIFGSRPTLSPIVRAGRVLQSVTSDPPSPEGRERQLGSPFRSSGSRDSGNGSREGQEGRITSRSPTARTLNFAHPSTTPASASRRSPFTNIGKSPQQVAAAAGGGDAEEVRPVPVNRSTSSRPSANSSMRHSPPSEGVMSWVANEAPLSPNLRGDNSLREAAASSTTKFTRPQFVPSQTRTQAPAAEAEPPEPSPEPEARDDETDIWEIEAQRETPKSAKQASFGTSKRFSYSQQRRPGLPMPWMRSSQTAPKSPRTGSVPVRLTLEGEDSPAQDATEANESEEYSLLAKRQEEEAQRAAGSPGKASKFDLSSFFSSPAAIPGMISGKLFPGSSKPAEKEQFEQAEQAEQPTQQEEPVAPITTTGNLFPPVPQKQFRPDTSGRRDLFSPGKSQRSQQSQQSSQSPVARGSASPDTPEQLARPTSAGNNQSFTPRQRQTSSTFAHPSSRQSVAVTPPRMQLSHADIRKWQQEMSSASASADESSDFIRPMLRPLPPKNASPTKSSLRSPLKPRTPGRVVEFTSSVLSPLEQARARNQHQMSSSVASQSNLHVQQQQEQRRPQQHQQPYRQQQAQQQPAQAHQQQYPDAGAEEDADDKENHDTSDISMADAPPLDRGPLSQTSWTRQHWLLLDELIQLRRQGPFDAHYERRSDKYLGKTVKSQGESMLLQRWHLDCVDAFKAEVGGWDEGALAKRLFALILGEEQRSRESEERSRPASGFMFH